MEGTVVLKRLLSKSRWLRSLFLMGRFLVRGLGAVRYVRVSFDGLDEEGLDISGLVEDDSLHVLLEHLLDGVPLRVGADVRNDFVLVLHLRFL